MTTIATAIADVNVNEPVNSNEPSKPEPSKLDQFGRDEAERTVVLSSPHAEAIDVEVVTGKHQTYDDALEYVINRGLAEIKRARDAARKTAEANLALAKRNGYANLMKSNPALITNSEFVATMMKDLGLVK